MTASTEPPDATVPHGPPTNVTNEYVDAHGTSNSAVPRLAAPLDSKVIPVSLAAGFVGGVVGWFVIRRLVEVLERRR